MLTHNDYDTHHTFDDENVSLPGSIESIKVVYDGGRLDIIVNGEAVYRTVSGTRDCSITIDNK